MAQTVTAPSATSHANGQAEAPALRPRPLLGLGSAIIGAEEEALVLQVVRNREPFRFYGNGGQPPAMVATLEKEFRELIGCKYALAVTSGTAALEVALGALGVGPGDEVIVPAFSWISCFTSIVRLGALPVLAEIDESICLAPGEITRLSNANTKAAIVVHYQGVAADMDALTKEAEAAGIALLEDCAESPGALHKGRRIGTIGQIGTFSFQFHKSVTSGEGGMVATDDPALYERAIRMHDIGQVRPYFKQFIEPQGSEFCGSQFRMSELQGAMALAQFRKLDMVRNHCRDVQARIVPTIEELPELELRRNPDPAGDSGFEIYFYLKDPELVPEFRRRLDALNVNCNKGTGTYAHYSHDYCRKGVAHSPAASPFAKLGPMPAKGYRPEDFPRTEDLTSRYIAIPIGMRYTLEDGDYIAACVRRVYNELF